MMLVGGLKQDVFETDATILWSWIATRIFTLPDSKVHVYVADIFITKLDYIPVCHSQGARAGCTIKMMMIHVHVHTVCLIINAR